MTAEDMVDSHRGEGLTAAARRRCQFLAAPSWRAVPSSTTALLCPEYKPRGVRKQYEPSERPLPSTCGKKRRALASSQHVVYPELSSSDSESSDSDSDSDSASDDGQHQQRVERLQFWPDPAMSDLLIQQACCPLDIGLEPSIDSLENKWGACYVMPAANLRKCGANEYVEACAAQHMPSHVSRPTKCSEELRADAEMPHIRQQREVHAMDASLLQVPPVRVGYQEEWLDVAPSTLSCWEKAPFEPYAAPKSVVYYVLCQNALQPEAQRLMRDLSAVYEGAGLGSHRPAPPSGHQALGAIRPVSDTMDPRPLSASAALKAPPCPGVALGAKSAALHAGKGILTPGDMPGTASASAETVFLHGLRSACQNLQHSLAAYPPSSSLHYVGSLEEHWDAGATVVVYIILPRCGKDPKSAASLAAPALLEAAVHLAPATSAAALLGKPSPLPSSPHIDIALQVVAPECLDDLSGSSCRALAFSVYQKMRRQPTASDVHRKENPPPPPTPPVIGFGTAGAAPAAADPGCGAEAPDSAPEDRVPTSTSLAVAEGEATTHRERPPQASSSLLHEPLFVLTPRMPAETSAASEAQDSVVLHCCYAWGGEPDKGATGGTAPTKGWVSVCWTDSRGELLEARLLPGPSGSSQALAHHPGTAGKCHFGEHSGSLQGMCYTLLQETLRVAARTAAAAGSRAKLKQLVITRLGPASAGELLLWDAVLSQYCSGNSTLRSLPCLETISLVSLTAEPPLQLDTTCETPNGAFLLQPQQGWNTKPCTPHLLNHVVWLPQSLPASMLLPGEDDRVRVMHIELLRHIGLKDGTRYRHCTSPSMPATPSNGDHSSAGAVQEEIAPAKAVAAQIASELHGLSALNAAFHGLCLFRPATTDGTGLGAGGWAGLRAHLPIHCNVAQRLWALACGAEEWRHSQEKT